MQNDSHRWQWALRRIEAPPAWAVTRGDPELVVAVVDTGVDPEHPELAGRVLRGHNVVNPGGPTRDDNGHGTAVAGLIGARGANSRGFSGICPDCKILPVKVNQANGAVAAEHIAQGIRWAVQAGARVINGSVGVVEWERGLTDDTLEELADAIRYALKQNVVVSIAAGPPVSPTPFPGTWATLWDFRGLMAVGGVDRHDKKAGCSPRSAFLSVTAPSDGVLTTFPKQDNRLYGTFGGTSAASPHVAGLAGLILSLQPALRPHEVKAIIASTADKLGGPGYHMEYGHGRINVWRAVQAAQARRPAAASGAGA